ncbi:MAG: type I restriction endonuclease subunit R [Zunongwangia sp.]|uniref:Type I restriction enzyme endonuclease subunit n=2 Tax=Zunongwangia profunda TaxID=398743 RepID=D5BEI7_ZUNPS|nr:type I restriction endonuclease subunit R [Zunongwangia profunda]ADF54972.1 HsdR [Zunongwangia profunda SM-A87]MAO38119.1 type I restriction endonuclease subunit R [Zunongwangia sp.]HAJ81198.1 type I restriction endonuclease subunit R [Zunongwangia profunda]HCV80064.1 type I restriction endonuclease subunit R [Zunongwangia profunda]|tara:strand:- start:914 stop:3916 length:3003 start_codon:yes stop_codon:yes gene_type:complete
MTTEANIEQACIDWLEDLGYTHKLGTSLPQNNVSVVLKDELAAFIARQYPHIPQDIQEFAVASFTHNIGADLDHRNRDFHLKLTKGVEFPYEDATGAEKAVHIYPIDFENPDNNNFWAVNQFSITGKNKRRPDIIIYINGLPLVVFELKNWYDEHTNIKEAFNQIQHYKKDIPQLFEYNALTIISDGNEAQHGMYSSGQEWFAAWKSIDGKTTFNDEDFQMHTLLFGLFPKARILDYIKNFIFHEDHNGTLIKKGAKYHQYFGVSYAVAAAQKAVRPVGNGRIGVVWHTQGSGKSIFMAIYTGILRSMQQFKNPTIVVQVDRSDLDFQLYENFVLAKDLVGDVQHADTTADLRKLLSAGAGGVIFTTIEKFRLKTGTEDTLKELEHPVLSTRENIIVMADEAHRTQYGLLDGFASNMRRALPNASFIGFTGTPVDSKDADTQEVFGDLIHIYDIRQAEEDNATVKIYYEPRLAKLHLWNEDIDAEVDAITEADEDNPNLKWAAIEDAAGSADRVAKISQDILSHYTKRIATLDGKAMIVCMSRRNCVKMYDALKELEDCPDIAVVMTGNISKDPVAWNEHFRTKHSTEALKKRFKNPEDPLRIVIVRDMWLTGFDAPCVHTMYVDKIMRGHNLMQAITRTNRVFKDKKNGVIVDYIGIGDNLKTATSKYTGSGGKGKPTVDMEQALELFFDQLQSCIAYLPEHVDYHNWKGLREADKVLLVKAALNHIIKDDEASMDFMKAEKTMSGLLSIVKSQSAIQHTAVDVLFVQHVSKAVRNAKSVTTTRGEQKEKVKELISQSIESEDIVDVFAMAGIERPDIAILDDTFLLGAKQEKDGNALKIELIKNILKDEIKLRLHKNIKKYTSLKEELEKVIDRYHNNALDSYATIAELVERAKDLQKEDTRIAELGLSEEELAFYDILAAKKEIIKEEGPIQDIVHGVVQAVKNNLQLDWTKKENAKASIRLAVKKELRGKISITKLNEILQDIMEQAEGQFGEWSA